MSYICNSQLFVKTKPLKIVSDISQDKNKDKEKDKEKVQVKNKHPRASKANTGINLSLRDRPRLSVLPEPISHNRMFLNVDQNTRGSS